MSSDEAVSYRRKSQRREEVTSSPVIKLPQGMTRIKIESAGKRTFRFVGFFATTRNKMRPAGPEKMLWPEETYYLHRNIGPNGEQVVCPNKTFGRPCPICEAMSRMSRDDAKLLLPKERQLFYVIDVDNVAAGIQLLDTSFHLLGKQLDAALDNTDEADGFDLFWHPSPKHAALVRISFTEEQMQQQKYYEASHVGFRKTDATPKVSKDQVAALRPLEDLLIVHDYATLKNKFMGAAGSAGDDSGWTDADSSPAPTTDEWDEPSGAKAPPAEPATKPRTRKPKAETPPATEPAPAATKASQPPADDWDDPAPAAPARGQAPAAAAQPPADDWDDPAPAPAATKASQPPADDWD